MRVLVISDLHAPYHHPRAFRFLRMMRRKYKTDCTVCIGDEADAHAWSRWGKSPGAKGAGDELTATRAALRELMRFDDTIQFCTSNHVARAYKQIAELGVPGEFVRPWNEVLDAPVGWTWADSVYVDGVRYFHGDGYGGAQVQRNAAFDTRGNVVLGHVHTAAGVQYHSTGSSVIWGMSVGCLIDFRCPAYDYARKHRQTPIIGCGVVLNGVPHFEPMGD